MKLPLGAVGGGCGGAMDDVLVVVALSIMQGRVGSLGPKTLNPSGPTQFWVCM